MTLTATKEEQKHKRVIYGIGNKFLYKVYGNYKIPTICWECKTLFQTKKGQEAVHGHAKMSRNL